MEKEEENLKHYLRTVYYTSPKIIKEHTLGR